MKKYILKIVLFFALVALFDAAIGAAGNYLISHCKNGDTFIRNYIATQCREDVIVMGSSRANHHYVPQVIGDSLHLSCFNAGYDALGILNMFGRYKLICRNHTPKILIYDIFAPNEIYGDGSDHLKYLDGLRPYASMPEIDSIFADIAPMERYKMLSKAYRYNTKILQIVGEFMGHTPPPPAGYLPLYGVMSYEAEAYKPEYTGQKPDSVKLNYVRKLIADTRSKGILLVLAVSPRYGANSNQDLLPIAKLCQEEGVPFLNHFTDSRFCSQKQFFKDSHHLNDEGARRYSAVIAKEVEALRDKRQQAAR